MAQRIKSVCCNFSGLLGRIARIIVLLLLTTLMPNVATAIDWDGGAGDGLWSSAMNWDGDVLPQSADIIYLGSGDGEVVLDTNFLLSGRLVLSGSGTTLRINSGVTFSLDDSSLPPGQFFVVDFDHGASIINDGVIQAITTSPAILGNGSGAFTNNSTVNGIRIASRADVVNTGTMNTVRYSTLGGSLHNTGLLDGFTFDLQVGAVLTNALGATINNDLSSRILSSAVLDNYGVLTNTGTITSQSIFNNFGTLDNTAGAYENNGVFNSECGSSLLGGISGTPPVVLSCDITPPVIVPIVTGTLGLAGWYVSDVSISWTVTDPESPIVSMVGCQPDNVTTDTTGATFTCTASSAGGGSSFSTTIMRDVTPPDVVFGDPSPPANAAGWHNSIVSVGYSCDDTTSGSGHSGVLQTGQDGTEVTVDATCTDTAGNSASATSGPFNIDGTPPTVSITSPIDGATFIQNEAIVSAYSCADVLSDVSSCIGPVISGAYVDTTVIDGQSFAVTGTDNADNTTSLTHGYIVITVSNAVANLMDLVASFNLQQGLDNSFDAKLSNLQAALDASNAGQRENAINMIQAFLNEAEAQRGKKLTNEQADSLAAEANRILMILLQ